VRPIVLKITAFGPYAGTETIDFRCMGERSFFLIHGPTGAGKTTILDAMCFSLFGRTSGEIREGKAMRSDYVDPKVATEVIFDFALGQETYRVKRSPEQEVLKKRGVGTTKVSSSATLWQRTGLTEDDAEGRVVANDWRKVTEAAENLLGFKYEQFRQVVMLPQGEFRKLLLAGSKDRESILETLFQTELYRRVEEHFKFTAKQLAEEVKEISGKRNWILEEAGVSSSNELIGQLENDREKHRELFTALEAARQTLKAAREGLAKEERLKAEFDDLEQVKNRLADLMNLKETMTVQQDRLTRAQRAALLAETAESIRRRKAEANEGEKKAAVLGAEFSLARQAEKLAKEEYLRQDQQSNMREAALLEVTRLKGLEVKIMELEQACKDLEQKEQLAGQKKAAWEKCSNQYRQLSDEVEKEKTQRDTLMGKASQVAALESVWRESDKKEKYRQELDALRRRYETKRKKHSELEQNFTVHEQVVLSARQELETMQSQWRFGQAAELANTLQEGKPCPVCGAEHHPRPAENVAAATSTIALELAQTKLKQAELCLEELRKPLRDSAIELETILVEGKKIKELVGADIDKEVVALRTETELAVAQLNEAKEAGTLLEKLDEKLALQKERMKIFEQQLAVLEEEQRAAQASVDAARAVCQERTAIVPNEFRQEGRLKLELEKTIATRDALVARWNRVQEEARKAALVLERIKAALAAATETFSQVKNRLEREQTDFTKRLLEAGFTYEKDFYEAIMQEHERDALASQIKEYEQQVIVTKDRFVRLSERVKDLTVPDIAVTKAQVGQAEILTESLGADVVRIETVIGKREEWLTQLQKQGEILKTLEEQYAILGHLAEVATGQNSLRLSFHRFVLAALFDDCMQAANTRLRKMSHGRYALKRMEEVIHRGSAGGLDIEIEDSYTGFSRHVTTLSGGESFLASLSLALGLADVVQSYSGGIHLDTIFIDEGFGTLDAESLEMALQALMELQRRGRLVGIISHVPELKERIEARLEILPSKIGSTTRWAGIG